MKIWIALAETDMALEDDELCDWWSLGDYYIGEFEKVKLRFYPNA